MENETIVRLKILSDSRNAEQISESIGLECDAVWKKGEARVKGATVKHEKNGWILNSGCSKSTPLAEQLVALLDRLKPAEMGISRMARDAEIQLSCVLYSDCRPELHFPPAIIQKIAKMGASLDVDFYLV